MCSPAIATGAMSAVAQSQSQYPSNKRKMKRKDNKRIMKRKDQDQSQSYSKNPMLNKEIMQAMFDGFSQIRSRIK